MEIKEVALVVEDLEEEWILMISLECSWEVEWEVWEAWVASVVWEVWEVEALKNIPLDLVDLYFNFKVINLLSKKEL
jgi:hypothetical protein